MIICAIFKHDKIDDEKTLTSRKSLRSDCSIHYEVYIEDGQGKIIQDIFGDTVDPRKLPKFDMEILVEKLHGFIKLLNDEPAIKSEIMQELGIDDNGVVQLTRNLQGFLGSLDPAAVV